jgi:hypothetical protein
MAAVAIRAVTQRLVQGNGAEARLSLARTAKLLVELGADHTTPALAQLPQFEFQKKFSSDRGQRVARFFSQRARKHDVVPTFGTCGARFERL